MRGMVGFESKLAMRVKRRKPSFWQRVKDFLRGIA